MYANTAESASASSHRGYPHPLYRGGGSASTPTPPGSGSSGGSSSSSSSSYGGRGSSSSSSSGGGGEPTRQRMSLLPPHHHHQHHQHHHLPPPQGNSSDYGGGGGGHQRNSNNPGGMHQPGGYGGPGGSDLMNKHPLSESPPCKKPRLTDAKPDLHMPLRIDTDRARSGPGTYNPQVEAISPTLPSESIRDESPLRSTKDDLLLNIARVDREIAKTESQIAKLKKKKQDMEEAATQPHKEKEDSSTPSESSVIQSLPQMIYAENRKKAAEAHGILQKLGPLNDLPLYNQPSDTPIYHENLKKFKEFKPKLLKFFQRRSKEKVRRDGYLTQKYSELSIEWQKKVEAIECNPKRKSAEAKKREMFEKVFPELRKQREDKERFSRCQRVKSDVEFEEILDGLHEQELEDKKMRSYAVIPPVQWDEKMRKLRFVNTNGLIEDPMQEYKEKQFVNLWTDQERETFKEKYLQHPKNFGMIKSYLDRKSNADCVLHYYLTKKAENYRQLLRKSRTRPRRNVGQNQNHNNNQQQASNSGSGSVVNASSSGGAGGGKDNGVTTRGQKEQKSDQNGGNGNGNGNGGGGTNSSSSSGNNNQSQQQQGGNNNSASNPNNDAISSESSTINNSTENKEGETQSPAPNEQSTSSTSFSGRRGAVNKADESKQENDMMDTSDEDMLEPNGDKGGPHTCVCCKTQVENNLGSRPISKSQASMYGLGEQDINPGDRVCNQCRCKAVRRRTKSSQCPIPTCPAKRARIKRLRPFPPKWAELEEPRKQAIIAKYQIPDNCTKCCTACFNRINRRMAPNVSLDEPDDPGCDTTRWSDEEIDWMKKGLSEVGTDWVKLSERIPSKSELQCRNFYFNFRKKYGLEGIVQEHKKAKGSSGPPTLTDEEESGSTTSSCDETGATTEPSSAVVGGIVNLHHHPHHHSNNKKREREPADDYDSSATVSAEEGSVEPEGPSKLPNSHEEIKVFPLNPNPASPLSLTISRGHPHSHQPQLHRAGSPQIIPAVSITPRPSGGFGPSPMPGRRYPSPDRGESSDNQENNMTLKVNDLLQATIERQLRIKPPASNGGGGGPSGPPHSSLHHPGPSVSPTITSILRSQDRAHLPPPQRGEGPQIQIHHVHPSSHHSHHHHHIGGDPHHHSHPHSHSHHPPPPPPQLTVIPGGIFQQHPSSYYGPAKVEQPPQVDPPDNCGTLDLSMKKRSPSPAHPGLSSHHRPPSNGPPPAHQGPLDFRQGSGGSEYFKQSQGNYGSSRGRPSPLPPPPPAKQPRLGGVGVGPPPPLTKPPSLSPIKDSGSITHGTPLNHPQAAMAAKYEGLLRPKEGSITQGTPLEKMRVGKDGTTYVTYDGRPAVVPQDYYKRGGAGGGMPGANYVFHGQSPNPYSFAQQRPPSSGPPRSSPPGQGGGGPGSTSAYPQDQHQNSRQIIINDYYTSQQMQNPPPHMTGARGLPELPKRHHTPGPPPHPQQLYVQQQSVSPFRQSPSPSMQQQQRQGSVIQRANPNRGVVVKVEPGRDDAFSRLVDAAVSAKSLPVPNDDSRNRVNLPRVDMVREGLGRSMAEIDRNPNSRSSQPPPPPRGLPPPPTHPGRPPMPPGMPMDAMRPDRTRLDHPSNPYGPATSRDGSDTTLTAASLIDAIITHQINQPSPNDRQSPAPSRSDRLFASFQRASQGQGVSPLPPSGPPPPLSLTTRDMMDREREREREEKIEIANHKGGTWGEHINLIINNDYALGKGTGSSHPHPPPRPSPNPQLVLPPTAQSPNNNNNKEGQQDPYPRSWKLRRALQRENEVKEAGGALPVSHPDEKHIIRVSQQEEGGSSSRPSSHHGPGGESQVAENGNEENMPNPPHPPIQTKGAAKDTTISPLDYVNNLIMMKMRTQEEDAGTPQQQNSSKGDSDDSKTLKSSQNHDGGIVANHVGESGNDDSGNKSGPEVMTQDKSKSDGPSEDLSRSKDDAPSSADSPASMVIDESNSNSAGDHASSGASSNPIPERDTKETVQPPSMDNNNATNAPVPPPPAPTSQPNYEPLTDEEN